MHEEITREEPPAWLLLEDCDYPERQLLDAEIVAPTLAETDLPVSHWCNWLAPASPAERWQSGQFYFDLAEGLGKLAGKAKPGELSTTVTTGLVERLAALDPTTPEAGPYLAEAAKRIYDLAWRINDISALLNRDARPGDIWLSAYRGICTGQDEAPDMTAAPRFKLLTPAELAAMPPLRHRIRGVLPAEGIAAIYGPSGSGKSFLVLDLLAAIDAGRAWFGHAATPCPCVYVALEGEAGVAQRVQAHIARHGRPENLRVVLAPLDIRLSADRRELVEAITAEGMGGGVLTLDTLNRAAPGSDENDSREMGEIITAMKALQAELGGLVLVVHHAGKDATRGLRGHSSLLAALDAVLEVTRDGERRSWQLAKSKDGADGEAHPFRLDVVELAPDAEGYPISSCVVEPEEPAADAVGRASVPQGGNQRILWDGLGELLKASHHFGEGEAPPTRPCVRLDDAINQLRGRLAVAPDRQTERARQAITGLVNRGLLNLRDGWLWCA